MSGFYLRRRTRVRQANLCEVSSIYGKVFWELKPAPRPSSRSVQRFRWPLRPSTAVRWSLQPVHHRHARSLAELPEHSIASKPAPVLPSRSKARVRAREATNDLTVSPWAGDQSPLEGSRA